MRLTELHVTDFRNYRAADLQIRAGRVLLLGDNAQGKSNLLEAIAFAAFGHSVRSPRDLEAIRVDAGEAIIRSRWERDIGTMAVDILLRANGRRAIRVDGHYQRRLADLLGRVRLVFFSAEDLAFVKGAPSERRRYLDLILFQLFPAYYGDLHHYQKVVGQRNAWLRGLAEGRRGASDDVQAVLDEQLVEAALPVMRRRRALVAALAPAAARYQAEIGGGGEVLQLAYRWSAAGLAADRECSADDVREALREQLRQLAGQERARAQTLIGPHRDDLAVTLNGQEARAFASQGQQRTIVLALKLAELAALWLDGDSPVLLLDDVLAELDVRRQRCLLEAIEDRVQTFITTTHLQDFGGAWLDQAEVFQVRAGELERSE